MSLAPESRRDRSWLVPAVVFFIALITYLATAPRGLTWAHDSADGGDLVAAAAVSGVPHPSGYPTYVLLARPFTRLPLGTLAWRVTLLSAIGGAVAAALVSAMVQDLASVTRPAGQLDGDDSVTSGAAAPTEQQTGYVSRSREALILASAAAAGLLLAVAPLLWDQAIVVEVYALQAGLAAVLLWSLLRWRLTARWGWAALGGLMAGLALGNHLTIIWMAPVAVACLAMPLPNRTGIPDRRRGGMAFGVAGLLGISVYAYLPLAATGDPPVNWGNPRTWDGFWWLVSGKAYRSLVLATGAQEVVVRLRAWFGLLWRDFRPWGLALAAVGGLVAWRRNRWLAASALLSLCLGLAWAIGYNASDSLWTLLPGWVLIALGVGLGLVELTGHLATAGRWGTAAGFLLCMLLVLVPLLMRWPEQDLHKDSEAEAFIAGVLEVVGSGGVVVTVGDRATFSMWYARYGNQDRKDLVPISRDLWPLADYRNTVTHSHPGLSAGTPSEALSTFLTSIAEDRPIYLLHAGVAPEGASVPGEFAVAGHAWKSVVDDNLEGWPGKLWQLIAAVPESPAGS